jgi:hypothetical protein
VGLVRILCVGLLFTFSLLADEAPDCLAKGKKVSINNPEILQLKVRSQNGFLSRGHILGRLARRYSKKSGHDHFSVLIGKSQTDTIEVIYNDDFGALPPLRAGMVVEACGDYITSNKPKGHYPASPDGAILHWVHATQGASSHEDGYLMIDGNLQGQRPPRRP